MLSCSRRSIALGFRGTAVAALVLLTAGCSALSFAPPQLNPDAEPKTSKVEDAIDVARKYAKAYRRSADDLADVPQAFELPLIAAAAVAAGGLAFGAHPDVALGAALGAGTITAAGQYYAPRARAAIMRQTSEALACVREAGKQVQYLDGAPATRAPKLLANSKEMETPGARRAQPFQAAATQFTIIAGQARAAARGMAIKAAAPRATKAAATARRAAGLDILAAAASDAADVARQTATKAAGAPDAILDAVDRIRNIAQRKLESASVVPVFGDVAASLKASQESAYTLAANIRSARKSFTDARGLVGDGGDDGDGDGDGDGKSLFKSLADGTVRSAQDAGISQDAETVAKLEAELADCVAKAPE